MLVEYLYTTFLYFILGRFDLFLVPVGQEADGFLYEAVFNRLLPG